MNRDPVLGSVLAVVAAVGLTVGCSGGKSEPASTSTKSGGVVRRSVKAQPGGERQFKDVQGVILRAPLGGTDGLFPTFEDNTGSAAYGDGVYTLTAAPVNATTDVGYGVEKLGPASGIVAQIDSSASPDDAGFGVVCRLHDHGRSYYRFGVGNDGTYSIAKVVDNDATILTGDGQWVENDAIDPNARDWKIDGECNGTDLILRVNGTVVDEVSDDSFADGEVGLFVETFDQPDASIAVSEFTAVGFADPDAPDHATRTAWERFVGQAPAAITRCELGNPDEVGVRPNPIFATSCENILYVQVDPADTENTFDQLVEQTGVRPRGIGDAFPDCRKQSNVKGNLAGHIGKEDVLPGGIACITDGDSVIVIWHDDNGLVGALHVKANDPAFVQDWGRDWLPLTVQPGPT